MGNSSKALLMGNECNSRDVREELEDKEGGLDELPLGSWEVDEGKDEEDGVGGGEDGKTTIVTKLMIAHDGRMEMMLVLTRCW